MKTIRVVLVGSAVAAGRRCAPFYGHWSMDDIRRYIDRRWTWMRSMAPDFAIVDVTVDTLDPTDDGDPDELRLCEQAQREDRP